MPVLLLIISAIQICVRQVLHVSTPLTMEEVYKALEEAAKDVPEATDWRNSVVDLMKILHLDSSLQARVKLARELDYHGQLDGSAAMNKWLHAQVMDRFARK